MNVVAKRDSEGVDFLTEYIELELESTEEKFIIYDKNFKETEKKSQIEDVNSETNKSILRRAWTYLTRTT